MAAGLLRTALSGSVVLSLYPLSQPRDERRAEQHPRLAPIRRVGGGAEVSAALSYWGRESMAAGLLRTALSGSVVLSLYPLSQPRDERRAEQHPRLAPIFFFRCWAVWLWPSARKLITWQDRPGAPSCHRHVGSRR